MTLRSIAIVFLLLPLSAGAHGAGAFWEAPSGKYIVDVGYDPAIFVEGTQARFDIGLLNQDRLPATFAHAWVRVVKDKETLLATGIGQQELGPTTLLYSLRDPGTYEISISYRTANAEELAAAAFPFVVESAGAPAFVVPAVALLIGAALGVVAAAFFTRRART